MKRVRGMKRVMVLVMRVEFDEESDGFSGKSNVNEGGRQLTATRAMATVKAKKWMMVMVTRLAGDGWQRRRVRVARAMATVMRVVGNEEAMATAARAMATKTMVAAER